MNDKLLATVFTNHSSFCRSLLDPFVGATVNSELGNTNKVGGQDQWF